MAYYLQRIPSSCISKFIIRNFGSQQAVGKYIQSVKRKKREPINQESYIWQRFPSKVKYKL